MIYLVRHGETDDNKNHIIQGDKPLNKKGKEQVKQTALELKDINFDVCFCSPLKRAKQTLKAIKKYHKKMPVVFDERIKERDYGELVGVCYDTIENYMAIRWNQKIVLHSSVESPDDLFMRVSGFYEDILPNLEGKNILIVAHSGIARMSYFYKQGRPTGGDYTNFEIKNSHILKIDN